MEKKAFVFDLDGTITDSAPGIERSVCYALEKMGRPVPDEQTLRKFLGPPLAVSFQAHCGLSAEEAAAATLHYRERYREIGWKENRVYPGMRSLLTDLREEGHFLGIATGKPQDATERILKHFGLFELFDRVAGPDPQHFHSGKEEQLREVLSGIRLPAVMIGDRESDVRAAEYLGVDAVAVLYGYGRREEFEGLPFSHTAVSVADLRSALGVAPVRRKGYFISFEGNDGSGKSTQVSLLAGFLESADFEVVTTREPGGSELAEKIRALLLDRDNSMMHDTTEALLFAASRAQHVRDIILPALAAGKVVLCDRYVDSSVAYQGAGKGLGMELVRRINAPAIDGCIPDLTILLDMGPDVALQRRKSASEADRLEALDMPFHERVGAAFRRMAAAEPCRFRVVPAGGEALSIAESVRACALDGLLLAGLR